MSDEEMRRKLDDEPREEEGGYQEEREAQRPTRVCDDDEPHQRCDEEGRWHASSVPERGERLAYRLGPEGGARWNG